MAQTIQWQNTIGGNNIEWCDFIELASDGNYISGGYSYSDISGDKNENSRGLNDYWFFKIDDISGNLLWQKTIGGNSTDHLTSAKETKDGGYILGGYSNSGISGEKTQSSRGADDYWVVKLDANRNIVWDKTYGGSGIDRLKTIIQTDDGGFLIGGESDSNISGEKTENRKGVIDIWLIKIDAFGTIIWQKTIGGNETNLVSSIIQTTDKNYIIAGSSNSNISGDKTQNSKGGSDYWILKIDPNGTIIWQNTIGGNNGDYAKSIIATSDGNYIIGGSSSSMISGDKTQNTVGNSNDVWLLKLNNNGQLIWQKNIGGDSTDELADLRLTADKGLILGILSYSKISGNKTEISRGESDYWIVKLDSDYNIEWDKTIGGDKIDSPHAIVQSRDGNYVAVGWSQSNKSGDKSENKSGLQDIWAVKIGICNQTFATSNSPVCIDKTLELKASGGTNYLWTGPNGFTSTDQNPTITNTKTNNGGEYSCLITGTGGCDDTKKINVIIGDVEAPVPDLVTLPTITGDCRTIITIIPTATDVCAGAITGTTTNSLSYSLPGSYTIVWNYNDGNGNTATQNQIVTIVSQPLPIANTPQTFCIQQNATINDIAITTGQNIKWYDALTAGNLLLNTTSLQNETTYYTSQTINGCESERLAVAIKIQDTPAPSGDANQPFCTGQNPTLDNIIVTGENIKWYNALTNGIGLANNTSLQNGTTYYASQTLNNCESKRLAITVSIQNTPTIPTGDTNPKFCKSENATLNNININEPNLRWYDSNISASPLPNNTLVQNNTTYYVSQAVGCESERLAVLVNVYDTAIPNANTQQTFCIDQNATIATINITGTSIIWYDAQTMGTILANTTILENKIYYATQTINGCESERLAVNVKIQDTQPPALNGNQSFCAQQNATISDIKINGQNIKWYDSFTTGTNLSESTPLEHGTIYYASQTINGCESERSSITINVLEPTTTECINYVDELPFPKFFTPNNDGYNDTWTIDFRYLKPNTRIQIFNRYGKLIKELATNTSWDGTYIGQDQPSSDYWFVVTRLNGTEFKSHFSLKR